MAAGGLSLVINHLACPVCEQALRAGDSTLNCPAGHSFDIARQGYVSLFGSRPRANTGDNPAMAAARERFLSHGHYAPIADAIIDATDETARGLCIDLAGGTGYYLAALLAERPGLIGLDIDLSTAALRRAAQAQERIAAVAADVWQRLPLKPSGAEYVLSIFGPRNLPEIHRILAADGHLIIVTPTARHLTELIARLDLVTVDPHKQQRIDAQLHDWTDVDKEVIEYTAAMSHADVLDDVLMGPSAHHVDARALKARVDALPEPIAVTVSVTVRVVTPPR